MVRLKSRTNCPPNGFQHEEKATHWKSWIAVPPSQWNFETLKAAVQQHRLANPGVASPVTDLNAIAEELDQENAMRVLTIRGAEIYITNDGNASPKVQALRSGVANAAAGLKKYVQNTISGARLWAEWFGEGGVPVTKELAQKRAVICIGCPHHVPGDFKQRWNEMMAREIMTILTALKDLDLSTPYDSQMKICDVCDCPMRAKIWTPLDLIKGHLKPEVQAKLWGECWITHE